MALFAANTKFDYFRPAMVDFITLVQNLGDIVGVDVQDEFFGRELLLRIAEHFGAIEIDDLTLHAFGLAAGIGKHIQDEYNVGRIFGQAAKTCLAVL